MFVLDAKERWPKIIARNSNALALELDTEYVLLEVFAELEVVLANVGISYSFKEWVLVCIMDLIYDYVNAALTSRVA